MFPYFSSEKTWAEVRGYMHCNDHIRGIDKGRYAEKVSTFRGKQPLNDCAEIVVFTTNFEAQNSVSFELNSLTCLYCVGYPVN